jgi:hypothetical protein
LYSAKTFRKMHLSPSLECSAPKTVALPHSFQLSYFGCCLIDVLDLSQVQCNSEQARDADGQLTLVAQAGRFLSNIMSGDCAIYRIGEEGSNSSVFLMTAWNRDAARPKPLGRPTKSNSLLATVYWDTMGNPSCTCDRGRLSFGAACVHKLALQALQERRQPSHVLLQKGQRVVEAPCSGVGQRVFGVY